MRRSGNAPSSFVLGKRSRNDTRSRFGSDCTNRSVFSLQIVLITSSGGVPRSSVMIENWFTWSFPGNSGRPSSISEKMHPALHTSTACQRRRAALYAPATSYFCHVSMISGAR